MSAIVSLHTNDTDIVNIYYILVIYKKEFSSRYIQLYGYANKLLLQKD